LRRTGLNRDRVTRLLVRSGLYETVNRMTPDSWKEVVPRGATEDRPDYSRSRAVLPSTNNGIYLKSIRDRQTVTELLSEFTHHEGSPIVSTAQGNEFYSGPFSGRGPDIILYPGEGWELSHKLSPVLDEPPISSGDIRTGTHRPIGVFAAYGPRIGSAKFSRDIRPWDIAASILHYFGLTPPEYFDGSALFEVKPEEKNVGRREPTSLAPAMGDEFRPNEQRLSRDEEEDLEKRFKSLGYT
jgi:hypothetical protein